MSTHPFDLRAAAAAANRQMVDGGDIACSLPCGIPQYLFRAWFPHGHFDADRAKQVIAEQPPTPLGRDNQNRLVYCMQKSSSAMETRYWEAEQQQRTLQEHLLAQQYQAAQDASHCDGLRRVLDECRQDHQ